MTIFGTVRQMGERHRGLFEPLTEQTL